MTDPPASTLFRLQEQRPGSVSFLNDDGDNVAIPTSDWMILFESANDIVVRPSQPAPDVATRAMRFILEDRGSIAVRFLGEGGQITMTPSTWERLFGCTHEIEVWVQAPGDPPSSSGQQVALRDSSSGGSTQGEVPESG